jgi:hypothetical protein
VAAAPRYRRTVFGSSPSCAASRFRGRPARHRRSTSLTSTIVTSRYIPPPGLGGGPGRRQCVARSDEGGKVLKNPTPPGGNGFEKPQSRGGNSFEKVLRTGSQGSENRQPAELSILCCLVFPSDASADRPRNARTFRRISGSRDSVRTSERLANVRLAALDDFRTGSSNQRESITLCISVSILIASPALAAPALRNRP